MTVFGESAGATNIAYLMSSPLAKGLFQRAIMQSGGYAVSEYRSLAEVEAIGEGLVATLGFDKAEDVTAALRAADAEDLLRTVLEDYWNWSSVPNVDGWVLEEVPAQVLESGRQAPVPLLIGFNSNEWTTLGHYSPDATLEGFHEALCGAYDESADRALEFYLASTDEEAAVAMEVWQTDSTFTCPSRFIADRMGRASSEAFFYVLTRSVPGPGGDQLGAYHGAETAYVTDNLALETWVSRDDRDQQLADVMSDYWVQFAISGDPNGGENPTWPIYSSESRSYLEIGDPIRAGSGIRPKHCDLYDELYSPWLGGG